MSRQSSNPTATAETDADVSDMKGGQPAIDPQELSEIDVNRTAPRTHPVHEADIVEMKVSVMPDGRQVLITDDADGDGHLYYIDLEPYGDVSLWQKYDTQKLDDVPDGQPPLYRLSVNGRWIITQAAVAPYYLETLSTDTPAT